MQKQKYFVMADIHSFYNEMIAALDKEGFDKSNPNHKLIILGDLFDRGPAAKEVFEFVKSLGDRFIYIRGNHEDLLEECLNELFSFKTPSQYHVSNGTLDTISQFCGLPARTLMFPTEEKIEKIADDLAEMYGFICHKAIDYYEIGGKVFVHGWIPCHHCGRQYLPIVDWKNVGTTFWKDARWTNGMEAWSRGIKLENQTIYCGHFHTSWGHSHLDMKLKEFPQKNKTNWQDSFKPYTKDGIVALDACTAYSGFCNCVTFEV